MCILPHDMTEIVVFVMASTLARKYVTWLVTQAIQSAKEKGLEVIYSKVHAVDNVRDNAGNGM